MPHRTRYSCVQRSLFLSGALLAGALAQAQNLNVTAANASNDAIYTVSFNPPGITVENTDQGFLHSVRSLVFTTNGVNDQVDLLAADNAGGLIVRYCGNFNPNASPAANTFGVTVWNSTEGGPTNPDGLSVDSAGDLFLVNQGSGTSTNPQVWVMQGLASCPPSPFAIPPPPTPAPNKITLIDSKFNAKETLEETLIAKSAIALTGNKPAVPQINAGDLLVLTSNPPTVLIYQSAISGQSPTSKTTPSVLINLPTGTQPGGMDFLPTDNSLLVTTGTGTTLKYTVDQIVPAGQPTTFGPNLGNGQFKVRAGQQGGVVSVFIANNNGGDILSFDASGTPGPIVTSGVQHPQGLALTNSGYQQFANCAQTCDVLGDGPIGPNGQGTPLLTHTVSAPAVAGNIVENMCVVATDPRIAHCGSCTNAANATNCTGLADPAHYQNGLPVAEVCGAGFDNGDPNHPLFIPNSMCGASGSNSSGLTLVRTLTSAYSGASFPFNGTYIETDSDFSGLPASPGNDPTFCYTAPFQMAGWAPLAGEGVNPGGLKSTANPVPINYVLDIVNGCATPHSGGGTLSLWVLGTTLDTDVTGGSAAGFATTEYTTLLATVTGEIAANALPAPSGGNFTSQLQQCVQESQGAFQKGLYLGAAQELLIEDSRVASAAVVESSPPFHAPFTPNSSYPNPSGLLRALLETTRFTVDVRLGGDLNRAAPANPPPLPSFTGPPDITPLVGPNPVPSAFLTASNGQTYTFNPTTSDFTGINTATLTYSLSGLPWAKLIPLANNQVSVSGKAKKAGSPFNVTLTVTDGCGATKQLTWTVTVS